MILALFALVWVLQSRTKPVPPPSDSVQAYTPGNTGVFDPVLPELHGHTAIPDQKQALPKLQAYITGLDHQPAKAELPG